jgi:hypothetical protein
MIERTIITGKFEFLIRIEENKINDNKKNKYTNKKFIYVSNNKNSENYNNENDQNVNKIKFKRKVFLNRILDKNITEEDLKILFVNINDLPIDEENKNILKFKNETIEGDKRIYNFESSNLLQRLSDILQGNLKLEKNAEDHANAIKNINFKEKPISEFIDNPRYTLFISNEEKVFKYASRNKNWTSCHRTKYKIVYDRGDAFICFGNNSIVKNKNDKYYESKKPDFRFYICPIYTKRINEKYRGIVIGIFITGLKGSYNNENLREVLKYVYSYLDSKFNILENLIVYTYNYIFSKFDLNHNEVFPIFRKLFLDNLIEVVHISNDYVEDMTGVCIYYKLPFVIREHDIVKKVYLYPKFMNGYEDYDNDEDMVDFI